MKTALFLRPLFVAALALTAGVAPAQTTVLTSGDNELSVNFVQAYVGTGTNPWRITVRDGFAQQEYAGVRNGSGDPQRVIFQAGLEARIEVPDDPRYSFLGQSASSAWILPEASDIEMLTPGISTETRPSAGWQGIGVSSDFLVKGIPTGTFLNNRVSLSLASATGPGDFFLYRLNGFGDPLISFRTDDGLDATDTRDFNAMTHTHFNWAFTAPGEYVLGFRASGTLASNGQYTQSDITTVRFHIIPEPGSALLLLIGLGVTRMRRWRPV